jgi:hypothetical protein
MSFFRWLMLTGFLASLAFTCVTLMKIGRLTQELPAAQAKPAAALEGLLFADKTGALAKLVQSQKDELGRLGDIPDAAGGLPAPSAPPAVAEPARAGLLLRDTESDKASVKISRGLARGSKPGSAVLLDSEGRRYEIESSRPAPTGIELMKREAAAGLMQVEAPAFFRDAGDIGTRKRRASILLLGSVGASVMLLVLIGRWLKA